MFATRLRTSASFLGLSLAILVGCERPAAKKGANAPPTVSVAVSTSRTVPINFRTIGSVKAMASVSVRPRVSGELVSVDFADGEEVKKGQKLFVIDPRSYDAAVKRAEATLAKDAALLKGAEINLKRIQRAGGALSTAELDTARTEVDSARATVAADEAAASSARLQLEFTTITAPIEGRAGATLVTPGNVVAPTDVGPLVVINQVSPIEVSFAVPEHRLPDVLAAREMGVPNVAVDVRNAEPATGKLTFVDNAVDPSTGTLTCRAEFSNARRRLWPGLFVDVTLTLGERPDSVLVPIAALQSGQAGAFLFVVGADKKATMRPVKVAFETGTEAVIAEGLKAGETVIVDGQLRVAPGMTVEVRKAAPAPAEAAK